MNFDPLLCLKRTCFTGGKTNFDSSICLTIAHKWIKINSSSSQVGLVQTQKWIKIKTPSKHIEIRVQRWEIKDDKVTYYANYHIEDYFGFKRWNNVVMHGTYQNGILDFRGVDSGLPHWETWHVIQKSGREEKIQNFHDFSDKLQGLKLIHFCV